MQSCVADEWMVLCETDVGGGCGVASSGQQTCTNVLLVHDARLMERDDVYDEDEWTFVSISIIGDVEQLFVEDDSLDRHSVSVLRSWDGQVHLHVEVPEQTRRSEARG